MRILISLSGLHRVNRGAEVALEAIGDQLARRGNEIVLLGGGHARPEDTYGFAHVPVVDRERFDRFPNPPLLRESAAYEGLLFNLAALRHRTKGFDLTLTCGYPWDNLFLRRGGIRRARPPHVFVTENGDWPADFDAGEARLFGCDGLVCTNPVYFERNRDRWRSTLIPNGVDVDVYTPGPSARERLCLPLGVPLVLMVSALIPSKRVADGVRAVASIDDAMLVVAGAGPEHAAVTELARDLLGPRFVCSTFAQADMPDLYRSADALLHLSRLESFGNVYVEAMATGLPVVAHRSPVTEWILGDEGTLLDTDDRGSLVSAIDEVLARGRAAGSDARTARAVSRFSWHAVGESYARFLGEVAGGS